VESNGCSLEMLQRSLSRSFAVFSWFWGLVSSQYLISTRWMSRRVLLRSLDRCCLGLVALLVAGGAAGVLPISLNCHLPLRRTHSPILVCNSCVFAAMRVTSTKSGRLEVICLYLKSGVRGKSHLGTTLLSSVSGIRRSPSRFCIVIRSLLP
jgi:hypothetical protein